MDNKCLDVDENLMVEIGTYESLEGNEFEGVEVACHVTLKRGQTNFHPTET